MYAEYGGYEDVGNEEVDALLERRYRELLAKRQELERRRLEKELEEARRQEILRTILTPEARERLYNIKLVKPEIAKIVEDRLIALAVQGKITRPLTDEELKAILEEIYTRTRREYRISIREK
ncbi:MAG: DNA-binding protein [Ignisphaera sp.]|uniref:DNA-binding protein ENU08_02340 n=1 Tax=Ignisphaera aggregans TaxID=334771 RepID=A0A7C4NM97_9CREN